MDFRESGFMAPVRLWILPLSMPGHTAPNGFFVVPRQSAPGTKNAARAWALKENVLQLSWYFSKFWSSSAVLRDTQSCYGFSAFGYGAQNLGFE